MVERAGHPGRRARGLSTLAAAVAMVGPLLALVPPSPATAITSVTVTAVKGSACGYITNVGLFGGPQAKLGCPPQVGTAAAPASASTLSPSVALPQPGGSSAELVATDADGAKGVYGPAVIFGGRWPENAQSGPQSGPITTKTQGTPAAVNAGGSVTSSADIGLFANPPSVPCARDFSPPCTAPGGFGPFPVEGDSLHVECTATQAGVTGSTRFTNAVLATSTDGNGNPVTIEPVPDVPPVNYTRSGVITNVGDVFTVVYNEQTVKADGSLTVNAVHMYLFGPTAVGEVIKGQAFCGTTPSPVTPSDTAPPTCGTLVVEPVGPDDPTPKVPRTELIGVSDAGGLQSITNVQATNATVQVGDPTSAEAYLRLTAGQTGPLPVTATRTNEALPMSWSFDATDVAGNTRHCGSGVAGGGLYRPLTPARTLDTRDGTGGIAGPIGPGATVSVQVTGRGGVPAGGVSAVAMNVTLTQPTGDGYLTLYPSGEPRPLAANLNFTPGKTVPNLVVVKLGTGGRVEMFNSAGSTHVIYDVAGWFADSGPGDDGHYQALAPARILDTRDGTGGSSVRLGPGGSLDLQVTGRGGVPASGAAAVVMNVAVTNTNAPSYLTVHPAGVARPLAANLNWASLDTVGNRVIAKLGAGGKVTMYNNAGSTDVVVDVNGWFSDGWVGTGSGTYAPLTPARILDTRTGVGGIPGPLSAAGTVEVQVTGQGGVPPTGVSAVILNATVVAPAGPGYLTVFPVGTAQPLVSDLNYAAGEIRPNLVVVKLGAGGKVGLFTSAGAHVVFDVAGWYS